MILPNLDPSGGRLSIFRVLIDYDGPQVFVVRNVAKSFYLAMHALPDASSDRWLYVRLSPARIKRIERGTESLRRAFADPEFSSTMIVRYIGGEVDVDFAPPDQEVEFLLPDPESFIIDTDLERDTLPAAPAIVRDVVPFDMSKPAPMWETRQEVIEYFKGIRTSVLVAAKTTRRPTMDLTFSLGERRTDYPIRNLGPVLSSAQMLLDVLSSKGTLPDRGPVPKTARSEAQLVAVASFPSSFGLRVEAEHGSLVTDRGLEDAIFSLFHMLRATGIASDFESIIKTYPRRAQRHLKAFVGALQRGGSSLAVDAGLPSQYVTHRMHLSKSDVEWLHKKLNQVVDDIEAVFSVDANLIAASLKTKFFMLSTDLGEEYSGRMSDKAVSQISEKRIGRLHSAKIEQTAILHEFTGEEIYKYRLLEISELQQG